MGKRPSLVIMGPATQVGISHNIGHMLYLLQQQLPPPLIPLWPPPRTHNTGMSGHSKFCPHSPEKCPKLRYLGARRSLQKLRQRPFYEPNFEQKSKHLRSIGDLPGRLGTWCQFQHSDRLIGGESRGGFPYIPAAFSNMTTIEGGTGINSDGKDRREKRIGFWGALLTTLFCREPTTERSGK